MFTIIVRRLLRYSVNNYYIHINSQVAKANKRLYFLRKLNEFHVDKTIMSLFYKSVIESIVTFSMITWFSGLTSLELRKVDKVRKQASRIIGLTQDNYVTIYERKLEQMMKTICKDSSHPLHYLVNALPSGRRLRCIICKTSRFSDTFMPHAIKHCNKRQLMF